MVLPCGRRLLNEPKMKRFERGINGENQRMCEKNEENETLRKISRNVNENEL